MKELTESVRYCSKQTMWTWAADHMIKAESPDKQLEGGFNKVMLRQGEGTKAVQSLSKFNQHKTVKLS